LTERNLKTRMILQVHDELIFEVPLQEKSEVETLVREQMEGVIHLKVPLVADVGFGPNWRDL
jgi:DNA polymerase-1